MFVCFLFADSYSLEGSTARRRDDRLSTTLGVVRKRLVDVVVSGRGEQPVTKGRRLDSLRVLDKRQGSSELLRRVRPVCPSVPLVSHL